MVEHSRTPKSPDEIHIKRAVNGGFIVRHSYDNSNSGPSYHPPQEHAFSNHKAMMAHVHTAMGGGKPLPETTREDDEQGTSTPPTKAAGAMAARTRGAGVD